MIKASAQVTLSAVRDIDSVWWYYKLQSSTLAAPAKPTSNPPSGWVTTEPTYTEGSTNTLYFCELTVYTDGTFDYSPVSVNSGYEAAKLAYNKAQAALGQIDTITQRFTTAGIDINGDAGSITSLVQRIETAQSTASAVASRVTTAESRLDQTDESIRGTVKKTELQSVVDGLATKESLQTMQTQTTQTASELSAAVTRISDTEDGLETYMKRMIFDLSGLHIRAGDDAKTELNLTEDKMRFLDEMGNVCAVIAQKLMTIENVQIGQTMQIGGGIWRVLGDESIGLFKK